MKSTRSKRADALVQAHRVGSIGQEKAANMGNPVELTRVKLQGLPDTFSSSMWSADGITRASRLYQRSSSTPPIHQSVAFQASRSFVLPRDDTQQSGMQLSYHLASAPSSTSAAKDNQIEECEVVTPASIGLDIQRSWSAPPIADPVRALSHVALRSVNATTCLLLTCKQRALAAVEPRIRRQPERDCADTGASVYISLRCLRCRTEMLTDR